MTTELIICIDIQNYLHVYSVGRWNTTELATRVAAVKPVDTVPVTVR